VHDFLHVANGTATMRLYLQDGTNVWRWDQQRQRISKQ
jgi:hypothetical protein